MTESKILIGNCLDKLKELPDASVQCCVTSPPYWGLRDYGTSDWVGGDSECDHNFGRNTMGGLSSKQSSNSGSLGSFKNLCKKCGAIREDKQLGLEETPEEYVENMVQVFREVHRVLRDDGTLWLNLGDSYWGGKGQSGQGSPEYQEARKDVSINKPYHQIAGSKLTRPSDGKHNIIKPKDLVGIPWRVAFALQADGWYLRQDIIWSKPNPMPESVRDRCTKAHEYIFLLAKSKKYYYDNEAIKEDAGNWGTRDRTNGKYNSEHNELLGADHAGLVGKEWEENPKRNKRSVWHVAPKPFAGAHFAVYPTELIEPCILAGTSEKGCCAKCGSPHERVVERTRIKRSELPKDDPRYRPNDYHGAYEEINGKGDAGYSESKTTGWQPTCNCESDVVPCVVLDPFSGSGTTGIVAINNNRDYIGLELNPEYAELSHNRITKECPNTLLEFMQ